MTIGKEEDLEQAKSIVEDMKDVQKATKEYYEYISNLDSFIDGSLETILQEFNKIGKSIDDAHNWQSCIVWINSRYCGYNGWANSNITSMEDLADRNECCLADVTSFGKNAFKNCKGLQAINIPQNIRVVGPMAFADCTNDVSLAIPDTVCYLSDFAFSNCSGLRQLSIPVDLSRYGVFIDCPNVQSIFYSAGHTGMMPPRITSIGNLYANGFIEYNARYSLSSVIFGEGVLNISEYAFCRVESDTYGVLTSVTLPDTITSIGQSAFQNNTNLNINGMPKALSSLGKNSFYNTGISFTQLPDGVTTVPSNCFGYCRQLTQIVIPSSVETIQDGAFSCSGLMKIIFLGAKPALNSTAFSYIPQAIAYYTSTLDGWNQGTLPTYNNRVIWIAADAEEYNRFILPDMLTAVGEEAFCGIAAQEVVLREGVLSVGSRAFADCPYLLRAVLPSSLTSIAEDAFDRNVLLLVPSDSWAETFAKDNDRMYMLSN